MAIIVEDGTGLSNSNSYGSYAGFLAYWADRGFTPTRTQQQIESDLIISTQYIDLNNTFKGCIVADNQALAWPRQGVYDKEGRLIASDVVPTQIANAVYEYAKRQGDADLQPDEPAGQNGEIKSERKKVGSLEKEIVYQDSSAYSTITAYPMADKWLSGLTVSGVAGGISDFVLRGL